MTTAQLTTLIAGGLLTVLAILFAMRAAKTSSGDDRAVAFVCLIFGPACVLAVALDLILGAVQ